MIRVFRARAFRKKHARFETVPRDHRSSKNQPKRAENGRERSLENVALFSCPGDGERVRDDVLVGRVVAPEGDHLARAHAQAIDDLVRGVEPGPRRRELPRVGPHVEFQALGRAPERQTADHQQHEDAVGRRRGDVGDLARAVDAAPRREEQARPGEDEREEERRGRRAALAEVVEARRLVEHLRLPEALRVDAVRAPGHSRPQAVRRVDHGPREDDVVVPEAHVGHQRARGTDAPEPPVQLAVGVRRAQFEALAQRELEEEERHAQQEEREEVGHEERAAAVAVAQVREAPDVADADAVADRGEQELRARVPLGPLRRRRGARQGRVGPRRLLPRRRRRRRAGVGHVVHLLLFLCSSRARCKAAARESLLL